MSVRTVTAATRAGSVRGVELDGLTVWRGVPFAAPPIGPLRHRPPAPMQSWTGVRDASEPPPRAWQSDADVGLFAAPNVVLPDCDEDCLYLNVTAPSEVAPGAGYPVVFWIHGGGYTRGTGSGGAVRDGATLASRGIVVVTINYRLGAFGYLSLADVLDGEEDSGAAGLLDQVAALRWVVDNIAAFGGDPARITLYGVSAGGKGVTNLLASPLTAGLAARAISSSGGEFLATSEQAAFSRRALFRELGIADSDAARVRDVPAADLLAAQEAIARGPSGTWVWRPVRTDRVLPQAPLEALAAGAAHGVALLLGNNANEGITFQALDPTTASQAARVLAESFGPSDGAALLRDYALAAPDLDETGIGLAIFADERYGVPSQRLADTQSAHAEVWRYRFDGAPPGVADAYLGGHGLDLGMVWAADLMAGSDNPRARLAQLMAETWAAFIKGTPPPWAPYDPERQLTMVLADEPHLVSAPRSERLTLWAGRSWQPGSWFDIGGVI